jgi:hypothetical protein
MPHLYRWEFYTLPGTEINTCDTRRRSPLATLHTPLGDSTRYPVSPPEKAPPTVRAKNAIAWERRRRIKGD